MNDSTNDVTPFRIIFENDDFVVIDKRSGLVVHPFDNSNEKTLVDYMFEKYPAMKEIPNEKSLQDGSVVALGGLVHKLDRDTSGVMVIAKSEAIQKALTELFTSHQVTKEYVALLGGIVQQDTLTIDAPLGRNKKDYKQTANPENPRGALRDALTQLEVTARNEKENTTLVKLFPKTGRTHQLRAHSAYIGHPIVGDVAYGSTIESRRILLHAKKLSFILNGEHFEFEAEIPEGFK